jgi:hypothetical protein
MAKRKSRSFTRIDRPEIVPVPTGVELLSEAARKASKPLGEMVAIQRERLAAPIAAARAKMSRGQRAAAWVLGLVLAAGAAGAGVGVARSGIAAVSGAMLGPAYRIQCKLPSGNFGTCNPMRGR